jgi:hypothetical protein
MSYSRMKINLHVKMLAYQLSNNLRVCIICVRYKHNTNLIKILTNGAI